MTTDYRKAYVTYNVTVTYSGRRRVHRRRQQRQREAGKQQQGESHHGHRVTMLLGFSKKL